MHKNHSSEDVFINDNHNNNNNNNGNGYDVLKEKIPALVFQYCFNHGIMNSLGISKKPNEQLVHLALLIESTKSHNPQELCKWIEKQPKQFFKWFCPP